MKDVCQQTAFFLCRLRDVFADFGLFLGSLLFGNVESTRAAAAVNGIVLHDLRQYGDRRLAGVQRVAVEKAFGHNLPAIRIDNLEGYVLHQPRGGGGRRHGDRQADHLHHRQGPVAVAVDLALGCGHLSGKSGYPDLKLAFVCPLGDHFAEIEIEHGFFDSVGIADEVETDRFHIRTGDIAGAVCGSGFIRCGNRFHIGLEFDLDDNVFVIPVAAADEILEPDHQVAIGIETADAVFEVVAMHVRTGAVENFAGLAVDGGFVAVVVNEDQRRAGSVDRRGFAGLVAEFEVTVCHVLEIVLPVAVRDHEDPDARARIDIERYLAFAADKIAAGPVKRRVFPRHFDVLDHAVRVDRVVADGALIPGAFAFERHGDGLRAGHRYGIGIDAVGAVGLCVDRVESRQIGQFVGRSGRAGRRCRIGEREIVDRKIVAVDTLKRDAAAVDVDHGIVAVLAAVIHERAEIADLGLRQVDRVAFADFEVLDQVVAEIAFEAERVGA